MEILQQAVMVLVPMILSLTVHEYAHARAAYALGDDTASRMGRMNLNPMSHLDLFGTILLPLIAILAPPTALRIPVTVVSVLAALVITGVVSARLGGAAMS